ncbi:MAG: phosphotransferase [Rhodobacteraceae bacterium]|nr:phosphotransferase [Paracoccaceae bacterium]
MKDIASPAWQAQVLAAAGLEPDGARWQTLPGGRVNRVWRVETATGTVAVKAYGPVTERGLFPNDPRAEWAALTAGWRAGRAPQPLHLAATPAGPVLVYRYLLALHPIRPAQAGRALAALHRSATWAGLARTAPERWRLPRGAQVRLRRWGLTEGALGAIRNALRDAARHRPAPAPVHGDPVPANMLATADGPVLIDWQCPALGDAATDLAIYLSPGMQRRYGAGPLSAGAQSRFRRAYGRSAVLSRYDRVAPALHARIAMHCAQRGDRAAAASEIALLNRLAREGRGRLP